MHAGHVSLIIAHMRGEGTNLLHVVCIVCVCSRCVCVLVQFVFALLFVMVCVFMYGIVRRRHTYTHTHTQGPDPVALRFILGLLEPARFLVPLAFQRCFPLTSLYIFFNQLMSINHHV